MISHFHGHCLVAPAKINVRVAAGRYCGRVLSRQARRINATLEFFILYKFLFFFLSSIYFCSFLLYHFWFLHSCLCRKVGPAETLWIGFENGLGRACPWEVRVHLWWCHKEGIISQKFFWLPNRKISFDDVKREEIFNMGYIHIYIYIYILSGRYFP
jgi:hypothetical protein